MKKGAIFDMDGLLFDTERLFAEGWGEMAKQFGQVPQPDFPRAVAGTSGAGMLEVIHRYYPEVDALAFRDGCIAYTEGILRKGIPERPGMREILSFFRNQGTKIAVASSSGREMILDNLCKSGIEAYFDAVISGDQVTRGKPEPDIFLLAAQRLGCAPEDCYVFEDGINGVRAGIAAGCTTIMIPDLYLPTDDLRTGCAGIYPSLFEAMQAIAADTL